MLRQLADSLHVRLSTDRDVHLIPKQGNCPSRAAGEIVIGLQCGSQSIPAD
jgi:hypothetical protein